MFFNAIAIFQTSETTKRRMIRNNQHNDFLVNSKSIHQQGLVKMVKRSSYFLLAQEPILGLNHASISWKSLIFQYTLRMLRTFISFC